MFAAVVRHVAGRGQQLPIERDLQAVMSWRRLAPWVILVTLLLAIYIDLPREWLPSSFPGSDIKTVLGLDLQGGVRVTLNVQPLARQTVTNEQVEIARNIIERRVSGIGVSEPQVRSEQGNDGSRRIVVEVPGVENEQQVRDLVGSTGQLQFIDPQGDALKEGDDVAPLLANGTVKELFNGGEIDPTSVAPTTNQ